MKRVHQVAAPAEHIQGLARMAWLGDQRTLADSNTLIAVAEEDSLAVAAGRKAAVVVA